MKLQLAQNNLVLLPGIDGAGSLFSSFVNALPPECSPVVVSYPPDQVLDYSHLVPRIREVIPWNNPFTIVAESFAGPLALKFAAIQPQDVRAVVLVCSFVTNPLHPMLKWVASLLRSTWVQKHPPEGILRKFLTGQNATPALLDQVKTAIQSVKPAVLAHRFRTVLEGDERQSLRSCRQPILYLLGKQDALVGRRGWSEIKKLRPDAKCVVLDGPHMLLQSRPREAALAVTEFLEHVDQHGSYPRIAVASSPALAHQSR